MPCAHMKSGAGTLPRSFNKDQTTGRNGVLSFLKNIFSSPSAPVPPVDDPDFGAIRFDGPEGGVGIWQMDSAWIVPEANAEVICASIPGDGNGPFPEARAFLLAKKASLSEIWADANAPLESLRKKWRPDTLGKPLSDVLKLSSIGLDEPMTSPPTWDVSFESRQGQWVSFTLVYSGSSLVTSRCDT